MSMFSKVRNKVEREVQKILGEQLQIYTQLTGWDITRWGSLFLMPYLWELKYDCTCSGYSNLTQQALRKRLRRRGKNWSRPKIEWRNTATTLHEYTEKSMNTQPFLDVCWYFIFSAVANSSRPFGIFSLVSLLRCHFPLLGALLPPVSPPRHRRWS